MFIHVDTYKKVKGVTEMTFTLEDAIILASKSHAGQKDKLGQSYILHPIRVMSKLSDPAAQIVAILHDTIEDTALTIDEIRDAGASEDVIEALQLLTKEKGKDYVQYLLGVAKNPLAKMVKLADIADNSDPERLNKLPADIREKLQEKYSKAKEVLNANPPIERGLSTVLYHGKGSGCNIYLDAYIERNNSNLMLEGQMTFTGGDSEFGDSDYEYWLTIPKENKDKLLLDMLRQYFGDGCGFGNFKTFCDVHNIAYKFFSY